MFCYKCGKKLPDEAQFCFKCGTKVLDGYVSEETICAKKIVNTFKIEKSEINFTEDESREILVRSIFEQNADKSSFYLRSYGYWKLDNFEDVYGKYYDMYGKIIDRNLTVAIKTLLSIGIDSYDKKTILNAALEKGNVQEYIDEYSNDMRLYEEKVNEFKRDADMRKQDKSPWRGGGFGLSGAIKGAIMAGALNAGSNAIGSLGDGLINAIDRKEVNNLKNKLFESRHAVDALGMAMYELICDIGAVVYEIMVREGKARKNSWWDYDKMMSKRNNIMDLYKDNEIDYGNALKELCDCFQKYPFAIYVLDDFHTINHDLLLDVLHLFSFTGTIHYAKRRYFGVDWAYSELYFETMIWDEENQMPELWNSKKVLERIKTNDLCVSLDSDTKKMVEELYIKQGCSLIAVQGILNGAKKAYKGHSSYNIVSKLANDEAFFKLPLTEMMLYDFANVFDAVDFLFKVLGNIYEREALEQIRKSIMEPLERINKQMLEMLKKANDNERNKVIRAFRESLFGKK